MKRHRPRSQHPRPVQPNPAASLCRLPVPPLRRQAPAAQGAEAARQGGGVAAAVAGRQGRLDAAQPQKGRHHQRVHGRERPHVRAAAEDHDPLGHQKHKVAVRCGPLACGCRARAPAACMRRVQHALCVARRRVTLCTHSRDAGSRPLLSPSVLPFRSHSRSPPHALARCTPTHVPLPSGLPPRAASSSGSSKTTCRRTTAASSRPWRRSTGLTTSSSPTSGPTGAQPRVHAIIIRCPWLLDACRCLCLPASRHSTHVHCMLTA